MYIDFVFMCDVVILFLKHFWKMQQHLCGSLCFLVVEAGKKVWRKHKLNMTDVAVDYLDDDLLTTALQGFLFDTDDENDRDHPDFEGDIIDGISSAAAEDEIMVEAICTSVCIVHIRFQLLFTFSFLASTRKEEESLRVTPRNFYTNTYCSKRSTPL